MTVSATPAVYTRLAQRSRFRRYCQAWTPTLGSGAFYVIAALGLAWLLVHYLRGRDLVTQWADAHGFVLEECRYRHLQRGPYLWTSSKSQAVYRIKVRTGDGSVYWGWARCGGWITGMLSSQFDVTWDAGKPPNV